MFGTARMQAQSNTTFRVYTDPSGAQFTVDGALYTSTATFQWPIGSQHIVSFVQSTLPTGAVMPATPGAPTLSPVQVNPNADVLYKFGGWVDSTGLLSPVNDPTQVVTADPSITSLKATATVSYRVLLNFFDDPPATSPPSCGAPGPIPSNEFRPGLIYISGQCYWNSAILYEPAGSVLKLNAFPFPGFVFLGWVGMPSAYLQNYTVNGPVSLIPTFSPAKRVRFLTSPLGLQVRVDGTAAPTLDTTISLGGACPQSETLPVLAPATIAPLCFGDFDFAPGSNHLVGAPTPQLDTTGHYWVFDSWGNGQAEDAIYMADTRTNTPDQVTVNFVPGVQASFVTSPAGLRLTVDGRANWPSYNFVWALNSTHQVSALAEQVTSNGRKYTFRNWSNSGSLSQAITMDETALDSGFRLIANYDVLSRVVIQSSPPGVSINVDGAACSTPCIVDRANGSQIHLTAPTSASPADGMRFDFISWSDSAAADRVFTITADTQTLTANYSASYRLSAASNPANGANFQLSPSSPDSFFLSGTRVNVTAVDNPGFKFVHWDGDLTGGYPSGAVTMSEPHTVSAFMAPVPYIAPAGVQNAAEPTPDGTVSPGSLIAITGQSLAPDTVQGPVNPLAQTIDGVTVTIGDRLLPLVAVNPQQITAQLPSDFAPGKYTLTVHGIGQPDVNGDFTATQDAPGLFTIPGNPQSLVLANHADGTPVTLDSPVQAGEAVTIFGTGFGPYLSPVIDGFPAPNQAPAVTDPVEILIADQTLSPDSCGAAPGLIGVAVCTLTVPAGLPSATNAALQIGVNGAMSGTVFLPLQ